MPAFRLQWEEEVELVLLSFQPREEQRQTRGTVAAGSAPQLGHTLQPFTHSFQTFVSLVTNGRLRLR